MFDFLNIVKIIINNENYLKKNFLGIELLPFYHSKLYPHRV